MYVTDVRNDLVDRFSSTRAYLSQFGGAATPQESFSYVAGLAVNSSGESTSPTQGEHLVVDEFSKPGPVPAVTRERLRK